MTESGVPRRTTFVTRLRGALTDQTRLQPGATLVVGVSGGADSLALVHGLWELRGELRLDLHVAHLNHQLRGPASDADAEFVRQTAADLGLPCHIQETDVAALSREERLGIEAAGRLARYRFFAAVVGDVGAAGVATAHTGDDQVETIVLNWLRGTGLAGLRGMLPVTRLRVDRPDGTLHSLRVLRPLLAFRRDETVAYCQSVGLAPRVDDSNSAMAYRRNRIRHELLPELETYNPRFREAALRMARLLSADHAFIAEEVQRRWGDVAIERSGVIAFDLERWLALPASIQGHLLREAADRLRGDLHGLGADHVEAAASAMRRRATGKCITWPRGLVVEVEHTRAIVRSVADASVGSRSLPEEPVPLHVPGITLLPDTGQTVEARIAIEPCDRERRSPWHVDLDFANTGSRLFVRRRKAGDRIRPLGLGHEKKLQDLLVDARVPRRLRDAVPVVIGPKGIVWVAGVRADDRYTLDKHTRSVLCLRVTPAGFDHVKRLE